MKFILRFIKPHGKLCAFTMLFTVVDVVGALVIPTFAAEMLNQGASADADFSLLVKICIKMLFPVPVIFVVSMVLTFQKDVAMGMILLCILAVITVTAGIIMHSTSPIFKKLQKKLDRMSRVLLENITGVRVIRAFNKEEAERLRLGREFEDYANTAVKVNKRFAVLDSISFLAINVFVILVYTFSGFRITAGHFRIGDITAIIEYAMLSLFFLMMAQMVILTLPRALECCARINEMLEFSPTIADKTKGKVREKTGTQDILVFQDVSFKFEDADEYTLRNLNFTCRRGETTAIIGGTGSGKPFPHQNGGKKEPGMCGKAAAVSCVSDGHRGRVLYRKGCHSGLQP